MREEKNWSLLFTYFRIEIREAWLPEISYIEEKYGTFCLTELKEKNITAEDLRLYNLLGRLMGVSLKDKYKNG